MKFVILGTLPGLNEYISAERSNRHSAAKMKKQTEYAIGMIARAQHRKAHFKRPVVMRYLWVGFTDSFSVDPKNPRVEIEIEEISGNEL